MGRKRARGEGSDEEADAIPTKRTRRDSWKVPEAMDDQTDLCATLLNRLRQCRGSEQKPLGDFLTRVPSRRMCPEYYDVVSQPIDLMKIQHKVVTDEYTAVSTFLSDVKLLLDNTRQFYSPSSPEYNQADELETEFMQILSEHGFGTTPLPKRADSAPLKSPLTLKIPKVHLQFTPPSSAQKTRKTSSSSEGARGGGPGPSKVAKSDGKKSASPVAKPGRGKVTRSQAWVQEYLDSDEPIKIYLAVVYGHKDHITGEYVAEPFRQLPSPTLYPEYYKVISQPMDLDTIRRNVEAGKYINLKAIQDDMIIMIKNAHHFNEPGSEIYKLASTLRKCIINKCSELERKYQTVSKTVPPKVLPKLSTDLASPSEGTEGSKKVPRLKISVTGETAKCRRASQSSMSDDVLAETSDEDWFSDDEKDKGESSQGKLLLHIKKEKLAGATPTSSSKPTDPVQKLVQAKKNPSLKKKLMAVYRSVVNKTDAQGRVLSELFVRRPSPKLYPDYYLVIKDPVDLREIQGKIKAGEFSGLDELGEALELMVSNATTFNEDGSQVYNDALELGGVARNAIVQLQKAWPDTPTGSSADPTALATQHAQSHKGPGRPRKSGSVTTPTSSASPAVPIHADVAALMQAFKNHMDRVGRHPWLTFKQLPTGAAASNSDYYSIVKKPIDMVIIQNKMSAGLYSKLDHIFDDLVMMLDNAFTFFPRSSQESQDAVALQRVVLKKYTDLRGADAGRQEAHNVKENVRKVLKRILSHTLRPKESANELRGVVATREVELQGEGVVKHSFKLKHMEKWMAEGDYQRLDLLQLDLLTLLKQASREGKRSAAGEVGRSFVAARDKYCGVGRDQLWSSVLSFSSQQLELELDEAARLPPPSPSPGPSPSTIASPASSQSGSNSTSTSSGSPKPIPGSSSSRPDLDDSMSGMEEEMEEGEGSSDEKQLTCEWGGVRYSAGEVVYVRPGEDSDQEKPYIVMIERFWKDNSNNMCFDGTWYYRVEETFHHATRKFYEKEVFRSDFHGVARMTQIIGKCCVILARDYLKYQPQGFEEKDIYVCESRYSYKTKSFKKIKTWTSRGFLPDLLPRATPLPFLNKVPSVFVTDSNKDTPTTDPQGKQSKVKGTGGVVKGHQRGRPYMGHSMRNVVTTVLNPDPSCVYYEQYCIDEDYFRLGDFVYLRSDQEHPFIARIDKMWTDKNGDPWIHGPWYVRPREVQHTPTRTFYRRELLLSNIQDSNPMRSISGKCVVMSLQEYYRRRPTGYAEEDVYILQSRYNEADKEIKKIKSIKQHQLSHEAIADEMYYLAQDVVPLKVASPLLFTEKFNPVEPTSLVATPPLSATKIPKVAGASAVATPLATGSGGKVGGINVTPQLLQQLLQSASKLSTSRPVVIPLPTTISATASGTSQLPQATVNSSPSVPAPSHPSPSQSPTLPTGQQIFPCLWAGCSEVYSGPVELYNHVVGPTPSGPNVSHLSKEAEGSFYCRWKGCPRNPLSGGKPFDSMNKIMRHMREVHLMKLSTLFGIGSRLPVRLGGSTTPPPPPPPPPAAPVPLPQATPTPSAIISTPVPEQATPSVPVSVSDTAPKKFVPGIFQPPPENRQQLVHSDIYLRYIQGMEKNSKNLSPSADSATLRSTCTPPAPIKPEDWFSPEALEKMGGGPGKKPSNKVVVDALWALRDKMIQDTLKLDEFLEQFN